MRHLGRLPNTPSIVLRLNSTNAVPPKRSAVLRALYRTVVLTGFFVLVTGGLVVGFFIYDATTYHEDNTYADCPVPEAALSPRRGGPKNLPIVDSLLDDEDCPHRKKQMEKPRLVILGSGWGVSRLY